MILLTGKDNPSFRNHLQYSTVSATERDRHNPLPASVVLQRLSIAWPRARHATKHIRTAAVYNTLSRKAGDVGDTGEGGTVLADRREDRQREHASTTWNFKKV